MYTTLLYLLLVYICFIPVSLKPIVNVQQMLYEDDIRLTDYQQSLIESAANKHDPTAPQKAVIREASLKWRHGIIPYIIDENLSEGIISNIEEAMEEFENNTCIRFKLKTKHDLDYVKFSYGIGCSSYIGRVGGEQPISLNDDCSTTGTVIHEMFHTLGRWHEHSRTDRNLYIKIQRSRIIPGYERNFAIASSIFATTQGVPYDYDSIMHYDAYAFSKDGTPTIVPTNNNIDLSRLGQRKGFSINDYLHVKSLYCPDGTGEWSSWSTWSACSRSCNGGVRTRSRTCVGGTDCAGQNIDNEQCNTENCNILPSWSSWGEWSGCSSSCGNGRASRERHCINGTNCIGKSHEFKNCNLKDCPEGPAWTQWSSWSDCSQTCLGGYKYRTRRCQNGFTKDCNGPSINRELCNSNISCTDDINQWTECTRSCGIGLQFRKKPNNTIESRECNIEPCGNEHCMQKVITHIGCYRIPDNILMDFHLNMSSHVMSVKQCGLEAHNKRHRYFSTLQNQCYSSFDSHEILGNLTICQENNNSSIAVYMINNRDWLLDSIDSITECGRNYCTYNCKYSSGINTTSTQYHHHMYRIIFTMALLVVLFIIY